MTDFNNRFQKTWDRNIPAIVKPSLGNAFLYYLRDFNSDIAITLQTMGGNTLWYAYEVATKEKNTLIQSGKLTPRPPMPFFPNMPTHQPTIAPIPKTASGYSFSFYIF